jgi:heme iron utilization protein
MSNTSLASTIIAKTSVASLGTLDRNGTPFVTLVTVAAVDRHHVVMLLSGLAVHTQNLRSNPAASLLMTTGDNSASDPMAAARVTLTGTATALTRGDDQLQREAFLARHPSSATYADFGDFAFYQFHIELAHLVAGFGRIETIRADRL